MKFSRVNHLRHDAVEAQGGHPADRFVVVESTFYWVPFYTVSTNK